MTTDADEFRAWVQPHLVAMARLAARLTTSHDADDVVQEALVRAWRRRESYDAGRGTPQAWLLAIVADRARRHRVRGPRPTTQLVDAPWADVAARTADVDRSLDVERALHRLARRQRLAVELHYFVGLTTAECAAVMECAEGTVKSTLSDARRHLRQRLEDTR